MRRGAAPLGLLGRLDVCRERAWLARLLLCRQGQLASWCTRW